jgi:hypothetical protein
MYADIDTAFVAPVAEELWQASAVIGREPDVFDPRVNASRSSLSNALVMAEPGADYVNRWRDEIAGTLDGSWSAHSCFLADDLARAHPDIVRVEPERTCHAFGPTPEGLRGLLVDPSTISLVSRPCIRSPPLVGRGTPRLQRCARAHHHRGVGAHQPVGLRADRAGTPAGARAVRVTHPQPHAQLRYVAEDDSTGYGDAADRLVRACAAGTPVEFRGWANTMGGAKPACSVLARDEHPDDAAVAGAPTVRISFPSTTRSCAACSPTAAHSWATRCGRPIARHGTGPSC